MPWHALAFRQGRLSAGKRAHAGRALPVVDLLTASLAVARRLARALGPAPCSNPRVQPALVRAALQLDRAAIAVDSRPQLRAALALYFLLLHIVALL